MKCNELADYRYTWPGSDESFICENHSSQLLVVANAIGLHLQIIPLMGDSTIKCHQEIKEEE